MPACWRRVFSGVLSFAQNRDTSPEYSTGHALSTSHCLTVQRPAADPSAETGCDHRRAGESPARCYSRRRALRTPISISHPGSETVFDQEGRTREEPGLQRWWTASPSSTSTSPRASQPDGTGFILPAGLQRHRRRCRGCPAEHRRTCRGSGFRQPRAAKRKAAFEFAQRLFDLRGKKPMVSVADGLMAPLPTW